MFGKFWRKRKIEDVADEETLAFIKAGIGSRALAVAIAEAVKDYVDAVTAGQLPYPVHRREGASVEEIWGGLRMEALHKLFNFGLSDPFILSEQEHQERLVNCWLVERPYLEFPQPHGERDADTIQAVFQCYVYLSTVGSEVCDRLTDRQTLELEGRDILDDLNAAAANLSGHGTLLEVVYDDVTAKSKSIALSARFGPHYEAGIKYVRDKLVTDGQDVSRFDDLTRRLLAAKTPDEFHAR